MGWQILNITKPGKLYLKDKQCVYDIEGEDKVSFPLDNLSVIVAESSNITFTAPLLSAVAANNIVLFVCNGGHQPCGIFYPYMQYFAYPKTAYLQQEWSLPFKNRIWQKITEAKITNQAEVLKHSNNILYKKLLAIAKEIESGDSKNAEGFAAALYWQGLFGKSFIRGNLDPVNSALNYGYAILRGAITRSLAATGFVPCFGLHHQNNLNQFNLADDIIEPFRPFIDIIVLQLHLQGRLSEELTPTIKQELIKVLINKAKYKDENISILTASDYTVSSLLKASSAKDYRVFNTPSLC